MAILEIISAALKISICSAEEIMQFQEILKGRVFYQTASSVRLVLSY
jgi:hypothetical protein